MMGFLYQTRRKYKGFTLIELLVVIAIIGILASVVAVAMSESRVQARNTQVLAQVDEYKKALELYFADNGEYPGQGSAPARVTRRCFGEGMSTLGPSNNGDCMALITAGYSEADADLVIDALSPYLSQAPTLEQANGYASPAYNGCTTTAVPPLATSNTSCTPRDFSLFFALEGVNEDCVKADLVNGNQSSSGNTICRLMLR